MEGIIMDIDAIHAEFRKKEEAFDAALARCEAEQAVGKTGLEAWRDADRINKELQVIAQSLTVGIENALSELSGDAA
jgi:hypothetical protein